MLNVYDEFLLMGYSRDEASYLADLAMAVGDYFQTLPPPMSVNEATVALERMIHRCNAEEDITDYESW